LEKATLNHIEEYKQEVITINSIIYQHYFYILYIKLQLPGEKKMNQRACLIFEARAGQCKKEQDLMTIKRMLLPEMDLEVRFTAEDVKAKKLAQQALQDAFDLIIALGGDGTISAVAEVMMGTGIPLGIIPRGTANAFATVLGIPTTVSEACEIILRGYTRPVDGAKTNYHSMITTVGIGLEAEALYRVEQKEKQNLGILSYGIANFQQLVNDLKNFEIWLETDEREIHLQGVAVTVANVAPLISLLAQGTKKAIVDDGLLYITMIAPTDTIDAIASTFSLLKAAIQGEATHRSSIVHLRSRYIKVRTNPPQKVAIDGDLAGETPIEIECIPSALTVFAPSKE